MLPFIPRKVAKSLQKKDPATFQPDGTKEKSSGDLPRPATSSRSMEPSTTDHSEQPSTSKGKNKAIQDNRWLSEKEYADMLRLTVSDYALWFDADLRRTIESAEEGYIPLTSLIDRLPLSDDMQPPPEAILVKAIRTHAADTFDVRVLVSTPSCQAWYGKDPKSRDTLGGYEICLKNAKEALHRARNSMRNEWDARTIYVENTPPQYRNIAGIYQFISCLLPKRDTDVLTARVQHISLPRHHLDKLDDQPKCKGFALVTLGTSEDVDYLLQNWSWQRARSTLDANASKHSQEAARFGFRTTAKIHWNKLNEEYLSYRQKLLDQIAKEESAIGDALPGASAAPAHAVAEVAEGTDTHVETRALDLSAPYPPGCLVFVRYVHPETNKTTLRKLLSQAFKDTEAPDVGIDYVDFNKGMNTCHIRLAAPRYTKQLVHFFSENPTVQAEGLDGAGTRRVDEKQKAIAVERVSGEREELYWGKVPEKVRRQAVEKAVRGSAQGLGGADQQKQEAGEPKRKRRRRG